MTMCIFSVWLLTFRLDLSSHRMEVKKNMIGGGGGCREVYAGGKGFSGRRIETCNG